MASFEPDSGSQPTPPPVDVPPSAPPPRADEPSRPSPPPVQPGKAPPPVVSPVAVTPDVSDQPPAAASTAPSDSFWSRPDGSAPPPRREQLPVKDHDHEYAQQAAAWEQESGEIVETAKENAPAWLASSVLHVTIMLVLALWAFSDPAPATFDLELMSELPGEQLIEDIVPLDMSNATDEEQALSLSTLDEVEDPLSAPPEPDDLLDAESLAPDISAPDIGNLLDGRQPGRKAAALAGYGPTDGSENAVSLGLAWLARQQQSDGSWSLVGPYPDGGQHFENRIAATAMAMLAFQGAGHTHKDNTRYGRALKKAVNFLLKEQDRNGDFWNPESESQSHLYTHGQATIAICELYAMTRDSRLRAPAQLAVDYCVEAQDPVYGGWRYNPGRAEDSDVSVTGWIVMGLQSARIGGLDVPPETLYAVEKFLDRAATKPRGVSSSTRFLLGSRYSYRPGEQVPLPAMTAEGLLCRQYLGWDRDDERMVEGLAFVTEPENQPSWFEDRNVYFWYYATQALHNVGGERWKAWNEVMRDLLVDHQAKTGDNKGSWHPFKPDRDEWAAAGGRLYVTCLSLYILEVYYRHLPIYQSAAE